MGTAKQGTEHRTRPGPFGPARALLPEDQKIETIRETETTASALERLCDTGYSQLPVLNDQGTVVGVFSWESFGRRLCEIHSLKLDLRQLPVKDTDLAKPCFIAPDVFIDTGTDWSKLDHVLVGDRDNLIGVLTITDVFGRLNDFAEAFVLLYEVEHEIRDMIAEVYPGDELQQVLNQLTMRDGNDEKTASNALRELVEGAQAVIQDDKLAKKIRFAVGLLQKASQSRPLNSLIDLTFSQYREIIFNKDNWPRFAKVFETSNELVRNDLEGVNELRNIVFHFRRGITARDTDRLRRFRDKIRYNRELFHSKMQEPIAAAHGGV